MGYLAAGIDDRFTAEGQCTGESRPFSFDAGNSDASTLHLQQLMANGQTQTCASVLPRYIRAGLRKAIEYMGQTCLGNANAGVCHLEGHGQPSWCPTIYYV